MAKLVRDGGDGIRRGVAVRDAAADSDSIADRGVGVDFRRIRPLKTTEMAKRSNVVAAVAAAAAAGGLAKWMTTMCCVGRLT
jgi:predicted butyrate kinase (DUF1464 family)